MRRPQQKLVNRFAWRPTDVDGYANLGQIYLALNRFDEARAITEEAQRHKLEDIALHLNLYALAFFQGNTAAMKQQMDWAIGKPGAEDWLLSSNPIPKPGLGNSEKPASYLGKLWRARAAAMRKSLPRYGKRTGRYAKR